MALNPIVYTENVVRNFLRYQLTRFPFFDPRLYQQMRRLAVEHVLGMLAAGDDIPTILEGYPWLERADMLARLAYAHRVIGHEGVAPELL